MAMKEYKARGEKLASIASLILVITEASWPLVPIIFLVPVAFGLFLVHAIKGEATVDRKYARLAFIIAGIAITTSFSALVAFLYIPNAMSVFADIGYIWFAIIWAVFFIGRDMLPGLLMLALNNFKVIDHPSASGNDPTKGVSPTIQP